MTKGNIFYATDNAKKHYREKRKKKSYCASCEIKKENNFNDSVIITEEILKD